MLLTYFTKSGERTMSSKNDLQTLLKKQYGINKNISQALAKEDCEQLIATLAMQPSLVKLVNAFATKNSDLSQNNRHYGHLRSQAEKKFKTLQIEYNQFEEQIAQLEQSKEKLVGRKQVLEAEIEQLTSQNQGLDSKVKTLTNHNDELLEANDRLKKDNKELKNVVDKIRLRLTKDIKTLLKYEDSEIRKALIRILSWTLG